MSLLINVCEILCTVLQSTRQNSSVDWTGISRWTFHGRSDFHKHLLRQQLARSVTLQRSTCSEGESVKSITCCSAAYMSQTSGQKRFTISEVTPDWHELMIPQHIMRPSIAHACEHYWTHGATGKHTTAPISRTRSSLVFHPAEGRRLSWLENTVG